MSTGNFLGEQASFYKLASLRHGVGGMSGLDLSAIMSEIRRLDNLINSLRDDGEQLVRENFQLKEQSDDLEKRMKALESRS